MQGARAHPHLAAQPTFNRLGVKYDSRTAQGLLAQQPGLAAKLLHSAKAALDAMGTNAKVHSCATQGACAWSWTSLRICMFQPADVP